MSDADQASSLVTVVFVDIEGSTALLERLGDGAGTAAVRSQLDAVRERLEPYGGREVKSLGDGLMLAFASPRMAVSFALASQRAMAGTAPRVRMGIHTGEVLAAASDPVGGTVNAAARIADRADGGEVLVSEVVRHLAGSAPAVGFVDRGRCRLKGFSERWHLFAAADQYVAPSGPATIGRADELVAIEGFLDAAATGAGRVLLFEGEAGIGKTHLLRTVIDGARQRGSRVLEGGTDELERRPATIVHAVLQSATEPMPARQRLAELLAAGPQPGEGVDLGYAVIDATIDLVESTARTKPVLVALEDLHWADELSLRVVAALIRRAGPSPLSVVGSFRPSPRPPLLDRVVEVSAASGGRHLVLLPLGEIDVLNLASARTGAAPSPALRARLAATAGNPLYVTELLRSLDGEGMLRTEAGVVDVIGDDLPADLRTTLVRRLSWLPVEGVELLRLASILGGSFTLRDLGVVTGRTVIDIAAGLHGASEAGLVVGEGDRLAFRHDLIREAIYTDMAVAVRRDLHRAAAEAFAVHGAPVTQIAQQYALGARPGDLDAVEWLDRAATEVLAVSPSSAIALYEKAVELAPPDWPARAALQARMIEPLAGCGRFDEGEAISQAVLASSPDSATEFVALRGRTAILGNRGDTMACIEALHLAAGAAGASPAERREQGALAAYLQILTGTASADAATEADRLLAEAIDTGDEPLECQARQTLGAVAAVAGRDDEALAHLLPANALLESGRLPWNSYLIADFWVAVCLTMLDRLDEAASVAEKSWRRAERAGSVATLPYGYVVLAYGQMLCGQYDEAVTTTAAALALMEEFGSSNFDIYCHAQLGTAAMHRGDNAAAADHLAAGGARLVAGGAPFGADRLLAAQASLLEAQGDTRAALNVAEATWNQTAPIRYLYISRGNAVQLAHLAVAEGRDDLAADVTETMAEGARRSSAGSAAAAALSCQGLVERRPAPLLDAVALYRKTPLRPQLARTCEYAAEVLTSDRRVEAVALLDEAAEIHLATGAMGNLARVDAALRRLGVRRRRQGTARPTLGWEALTRKERQVTDLVAEGLTNPEIGARLYISRRTVETHLSHVFGKLGVSTRAQVAAAAARHGAAGG